MSNENLALELLTNANKLIDEMQNKSRHSFTISVAMFSAVIRLISKSDKDEAQTILKDLQSIEDADCNLKVAKNIVIDYCYKHLELLRYKADRKNLY
jgi:hypothetical protein